MSTNLEWPAHNCMLLSYGITTNESMNKMYQRTDWSYFDVLIDGCLCFKSASCS